VIGNVPASGTEIIKRLGDEHMKTGKLILYTSADSVFQIAAHEEVVPPDDLYKICQKARRILNRYNVGRVIARPFIGSNGNFTRTYRRKDFSIPPPEETLLDRLCYKCIDVVAIGKISEIFAGRGITTSIHTEGNKDGLERTIVALREFERALIFTNLVDFDMLYGHRRNPDGYCTALSEFDAYLPSIIQAMHTGDMLIITADHGCDPTLKRHTDHTREYVPLLVYRKDSSAGVDLGLRSTFSDVGQTIAEFFSINPLSNGRSFLSQLKCF
jgi:phosphopentomutase